MLAKQLGRGAPRLGRNSSPLGWAQIPVYWPTISRLHCSRCLHSQLPQSPKRLRPP